MREAARLEARREARKEAERVALEVLEEETTRLRVRRRMAETLRDFDWFK
ncbi:MAG TPA: hypothetical protein VNO56_08000 [Gaiellaceae bacterium]|nr:hypothetical protein [Gaiellaceae bacterium]